MPDKVPDEELMKLLKEMLEEDGAAKPDEYLQHFYDEMKKNEDNAAAAIKKQQDEMATFVQKNTPSLDKWNPKSDGTPVEYSTDEYAEMAEAIKEVMHGGSEEAIANIEAALSELGGAIKDGDTEAKKLLEQINAIGVEIKPSGVEIQRKPRCWNCKANLKVEPNAKLLKEHQMVCTSKACIDYVMALHWSPAEKAEINPGWATPREVKFELVDEPEDPRPSLPDKLRPDKRIIDY